MNRHTALYARIGALALGIVDPRGPYCVRLPRPRLRPALPERSRPHIGRTARLPLRPLPLTLPTSTPPTRTPTACSASSRRGGGEPADGYLGGTAPSCSWTTGANGFHDHVPLSLRPPGPTIDAPAIVGHMGPESVGPTGRESEVRACLDVLRGDTSRPRIVLITGGAGIGKSTVFNAVTADIHPSWTFRAARENAACPRRRWPTSSRPGRSAAVPSSGAGRGPAGRRSSSVPPARRPPTRQSPARPTTCCPSP